MLTRLPCSARQRILLAILTCSLTSCPTACFGQRSSDDVERTNKAQHPGIRVLDDKLKNRLNTAVDRSLQWLADQQLPDGSFPTLENGQPAVTSLCLLAFLSNGHSVGEGPYGDTLGKAVDYILDQQKPNGLIARLAPLGSPITRQVQHEVGYTAVYNHALSGLALTEVYGHLNDQRAGRATLVIEKAIVATLEMQRWRKEKPTDQGGWRYLDKQEKIDSDLSVTGWMLMFLRSARNAGFDVPLESIDQAVKYIDVCYVRSQGTFTYLDRSKMHITRAMAGAGILALAHAGKHDSERARKAGDWILRHDFNEYNSYKSWSPKVQGPDRYHYGLLTCCQGMYQLGGRYWAEFYPPTVRSILDNQQPDGAWPPDKSYRDGLYGSSYTTAMCVLSLSAANDLIPIFQR